MSTTLLQGRSQLQLQTGIIGNPDFPPDLLNRYLNLAQKYVQRVLLSLGVKFEKSTDMTGEILSATYNGVALKRILLSSINTASGYNAAVDPDSIRLIECGDGVTLAASTISGVAKEAGEQFFHEVISDLYLAPTMKEPRFLRQADQIILAPSTITALKVHYNYVVKDLTADANLFEISDEYIEDVINRAEVDVLERLEKMDNVFTAIQKVESDIKQKFELEFAKRINSDSEKPLDKGAMLQ